MVNERQRRERPAVGNKTSPDIFWSNHRRRYRSTEQRFSPELMKIMIKLIKFKNYIFIVSKKKNI